MYPFDQVLECQDCGEVVHRLEPHEARAVADHPENFIVYCRPCRQVRGKPPGIFTASPG